MKAVLLLLVLLTGGCVTMNPKNDPTESHVRIALSKPAFFGNELVAFTIENRSQQPVFIQTKPFTNVKTQNRISLDATVYQQVVQNGRTSGFSPLEIFDHRGSIISKQEYSVASLRLEPGDILNVFWEGTAFKQTGPDERNDWESFQPTGRFKIRIAYSFFEQSQPSRTSPDSTIPLFIESPEFEIVASDSALIQSADLNQSFPLALGDEVQVKGTSLTIRFEKIEAGMGPGQEPVGALNEPIAAMTFAVSDGKTTQRIQSNDTVDQTVLGYRIQSIGGVAIPYDRLGPPGQNPRAYIQLRVSRAEN